MKKLSIFIIFLCTYGISVAQTLSEKQMINARATGYAIVAAKNPGVEFSILMIPWDGVNTLEYNANNQINRGWHAQAVVKGNYFYQGFDGTDFSRYSSVLMSQESFDKYKNVGDQWWIVCSTLPKFSSKITDGLTSRQMAHARATGYAVVAAKNPGVDFSIIMIPWDGINTLEHNANNQINGGWHPQAAIKGNYFYQSFDGTDFSRYSSVVTSEAKFDRYKSTGEQWWIACSTLPSFHSAQSSEVAGIWEEIGSKAYYNLGNVGIGTDDPDEALTVKGSIHANEIRLDTDARVVPDYVFEPSYDLMSLDEVKEFINTEKHLPEVPSAVEIAKAGLKLKEMNLLLLKKIEELTLHAIAQKEQLEQQEIRIAKLENK